MPRKCPVCNSSLQFTKPVEINTRVVCSNCGLELEVVWLYPLELAKVSSRDPDRGKKQKIQNKLKRI